MRKVIRKRGWLLCAAVLFAALAHGEDPPANLIRRVIERETETQRVQANYTYQQTVAVEEFDRRGMKTGEYRESRDIIFSPSHDRTEQLTGPPKNSLALLKLTERTFATSATFNLSCLPPIKRLSTKPSSGARKSSKAPTVG